MAMYVPRGEDLDKLITALSEIKNKTSDVSPLLDDIAKHVTSVLAVQKGIGFLDLKYLILLQYLIDLTLLMARKVSGKNIEGHSVVGRLVEVRTTIEKVRPIDQKLKYQINKLLKASKGGDIADASALAYRPNPENLISKVDDEEESNEEEKERRPAVYVPPKVSAVPYEDDTAISRSKKQMERSRKKVLNSSLLRDLREEYSEQPIEVRDDYKSLKLARVKEREQDKERYEEENLLRLPVSKKDKRLMRLKGSGLSDMTDFSRMSAFDRDSDGDDANFKAKKRKFLSKKQKKKSFKRMKRR